jgi:hypothetical protein
MQFKFARSTKPAGQFYFIIKPNLISEYYVRGCRYVAMTGFRKNRRAVLKRIPTDSESKNFDISAFESSPAKFLNRPVPRKEGISATAKVLVDSLHQTSFRSIIDDLNRVSISCRH